MSNHIENLNTKNIDPSRNGEAGFSLVQIALGIIVLSIIAVPLMKLYQVEQAKHQVTLNLEKMNRVTYALNKFAQQNTRLPVPADPALPANNTNYGSEVDVPASMACAGVFSARNVRCASPAGGEVLMGAIPFLALGLNEEDTIDMNGMKMSYAVTRTMTNRTTYNNAGGRIRILNQNTTDETLNGGTDNPTTDAAGTSNVLYVVISHGGDRRGAYDKSGGQTACATVGMDRQNCSNTGIFRGMQERNSAGAMSPGLSKSVSLGAGADYFDDTIRYRNSVLDGMWAQQDNLNATGNNNIYLSGRRQVLVGGNRFRSGPADDPKHMLDVVGNARASNRVISQSLCDSTDGTSNCFRIKNISASASETVPEDRPVYCGTTGATTGTNGRPLVQIVSSAARNGHAQQNCGASRTLNSTLPATACPYGIRSWSGGTYTCNPS